jgi:hypothetical protein
LHPVQETGAIRGLNLYNLHAFQVTIRIRLKNRMQSAAPLPKGDATVVAIRIRLKNRMQCQGLTVSLADSARCNPHPAPEPDAITRVWCIIDTYLVAIRIRHQNRMQ